MNGGRVSPAAPSSVAVPAPTGVWTGPFAAGLLPAQAAAAFSGAFLIFLVQPMVAKMLLPALGGTPAVWNTCAVFFQVTLLAGYLYAHALKRLPLGRAVLVHVAVLAVALAPLPFAQPDDGAARAALESPIGWTLGWLLRRVGAPFAAVAATAPLLQQWLSRARHPAARDPYRLYAASNVGSLLALVAYPLAIEPALDLATQARLWTAGFVFFAVLMAGAGALARAGTDGESTAGPADTAPISWRARARWLLLAFIPASLMLGVTQYLTTDIAPIPLLWVAPLAIYLLTFIIAFAYPRPSARGRLLPRLCMVAMAAVAWLSATGTPRLSLVLAVHLTLLFLYGWRCHGRLNDERPAPTRLSEFYLLMAAGGVLGGVFNALVAPLIFRDVVEYPAVLVLACVAVPDRSPVRSAVGSPWWPGHLRRLAVVAFAVCMAFLLLVPRRGIGAWTIIERGRTFFGAHVVAHDQAANRHVLMHGSTFHGVQNLDAGSRDEPLSYYARSGPVGDVFAGAAGGDELHDVAVIGLGAGTLAAYAAPGRAIHFFEIDPGMVTVANNRSLFTYLADRRGPVDVTLVDGRLGIAGAADSSLDLIVVDAFSSDAVPVHLLTGEALDLYFRKLRPSGIVLLNISNRYLRLERVLAALARDHQLYAALRLDVPTPARAAQGIMASKWALLARSPAAAPSLQARGWEALASRPDDPIWTDRQSSLIPLLGSDR